MCAQECSYCVIHVGTETICACMCTQVHTPSPTRCPIYRLVNTAHEESCKQQQEAANDRRRTISGSFARGQKKSRLSCNTRAAAWQKALCSTHPLQMSDVVSALSATNAPTSANINRTVVVFAACAKHHQAPQIHPPMHATHAHSDPFRMEAEAVHSANQAHSCTPQQPHFQLAQAARSHRCFALSQATSATCWSAGAAACPARAVADPPCRP